MRSNDVAQEQLRTVLHVADSESGGGAEKVFRQTVEATRDLGMNVKTYVSDGRRRLTSYVFSRRHMRGVRAAILQHDPQIVHLHNFYHYLSPSVLMAIRLARRAGWRGGVVFTAHDYHLVWPNSGLQRFAKGKPVNVDPAAATKLRPWWRFDDRSWIHSFLKLAQHLTAYRLLGLRNEIDIVLSPSGFLAGAIHDVTGLPVEVMRNPLDQAFTGDHALAPSSAPTLIFAGRLAPEKGLLQAMTELDRSIERGRLPRDLELRVCGSGPQEHELREHARSLHNLRATLLGPLSSDDVAAQMGAAWAFILPSSWYEVSPLSIIEAAQRGLPVIAPRQGGLAETARLTQNHWLYEFGDEDSFETAVARALTGPRSNSLVNPQDFSAATFVAHLIDGYAKARATSWIRP